MTCISTTVISRGAAGCVACVAWVVIFACAAGGAQAGGGNHDPHALSAAEIAEFLPLACAHAQKIKHGHGSNENPFDYRCQRLGGYPSDPGNLGKLRLRRDRDLTLEAIAFGSFTRAGADEAYISYSGDFEDDTTLFGGGILFEHRKKAWHVVTWYPAERRADCVALPSNGKQELLCLDGDGHADSSSEGIDATLTAQDATGQPGSAERWKLEHETVYSLARPVLALRDNNFASCNDRRMNPSHIVDTNDPCSGLAKGVGFLIEITGLKRSRRAGVLAEAAVVYSAPEDVEKACRVTCYLDARQQSGVVLFSLQGTRILVTMPGGFNLQSAIRP